MQEGKEEEIAKVRILYQDAEYELGEQVLDRIIAIASKKLRDEIVTSKLGLGIFSVKDLAEEAKLNPGVRVMKKGFELEFYKAMNETLLYAIETDMLENYKVTELNSSITISSPDLASTTALKSIRERQKTKKLEEFHKIETKQLDLDITEIYARKLQNFFKLVSQEILL